MNKMEGRTIPPSPRTWCGVQINDTFLDPPVKPEGDDGMVRGDEDRLDGRGWKPLWFGAKALEPRDNA